MEAVAGRRVIGAHQGGILLDRHKAFCRHRIVIVVTRERPRHSFAEKVGKQGEINPKGPRNLYLIVVWRE